MISDLASILHFIAAVNLYEPFPVSSIRDGDTAIIRKTSDFTITGNGDNTAWDKTGWQQFIKIDSGGKNYNSKSKMLYSEKGIYLLFAGEDERISTKNYKDDDEIYEGDVFEFFLQPDPGKPPYFEYEINQLDKQLILILSGSPNKNLAWSPWRYEYKMNPIIRKKVSIKSETKKNVAVVKTGEVMKPGAAIKYWSAEIFFPYEILGLLPGLPPKSNMVWRANFCRIDYDSGKMVQWTWSKKIKSSFHELENFGFILFE